MTDPAAPPTAATEPAGLLAALLADAGGTVDGAALGSVEAAPAIDGLPAARAVALRAAWSGARLHAGEPGLVAANDPDVALLVGDWCFAHALGAVARAGDVQAIALLSDAIAAGSSGASGEPASAAELAEIWGDAGRRMACSG